MDDLRESLLIVAPRGRGRPRVEEPKTSVSTWLPIDAADHLAQLAHRHDVSVSALVRQFVLVQLRKK